jgi:hypothetical protein
MAEAIAQLTKGLEMLTNLPDSVSRQRQELVLQIALGRALMVTQGYAAPAVGETYTRARALCEQLGRPPEVMPALYGQSVYHLLRGQLSLARALAADFLKQGEDSANVGMTAMGHRLSGLSCFYFGEFLASRAHLEQALARFDPAHRPFYESFHIQDPLGPLLNYLSWDLICLGYLDQARLRSEAAVEEASKLGHAQPGHCADLGLLGPLGDGLTRGIAGAGECAHRRHGRARLSLATCCRNRLPGKGAGGRWANRGRNCAAPSRRGRIPRDRGGDVGALLSHIARRG